MTQIENLEERLNDFDPAVRAEALDALVGLMEGGEIETAPVKEVANMHCHTFFSFNAYGYSPTGLAWLARRHGYKLMGIVDFDVLDGVDEFFRACDRLGVRGSAGMETRVYIPEFSTREINSPGEPGVYYYMGIGFTSSAVPEEAADVAADLRARAHERNRGLMQRINAHLDPVTIDYEEDVLPLSPGDMPTERHMVVSYARAAERAVSDPAAFWTEKLDVPREDIEAAIGDPAKFQTLIRAKLMKRGGVGYVPPGPDTFPSIEKVNALTLACGALPCAAWLNGVSEGEQAIEELLDLLIGKGVAAFNIVPDRNWNFTDPDEKAKKLQNLYDVVELAQKLDLPINVGTEMNSFGQKRIDDFDAPELAPVRQALLDGAYFVYGHTLLARARSLGYQSEWAEANLPTRRERNAFYTQVGRHMPPDFGALTGLEPAMSPADMLSALGAN